MDHLEKHRAFVGHRWVESYGGAGDGRHVPVLAPGDEGELAELLAALSTDGRAFAPLGAGLSFGAHALSRGCAVSTERFREYRLDSRRRRLRVGTGLRVGEVQTRLLEEGFVAAVLPSTSLATVGGSVSTDTYSRMTPGLGRESRWVRSLRIVTPRGEILDCSRSRESELFFAAVGGLGLIGVIVSVEYEVLHIGEHPVFRSLACAFEGVSGLEFLDPRRPLDTLGPLGDTAEDWPGAGCLVIQRGGRCRTLLTRHRWDDSEKRRPTIIHQRGRRRVALDTAVRAAPRLASWLWQRNWRRGRRVEFWDDPWSANFFMDANIESKTWARRLGLPVGLIQQSFVLPATPDGGLGRLEEFTKRCLAALAQAKVTAAMMDVGFMPAGEGFLMSDHGPTDAFVVSIALEGASVTGGVRLKTLLRDLTRTCRQDFGGRLHLTKNLYCEEEDLAAMFGPACFRLAALRARHDPASVLRTELGDRLFAAVGTRARFNRHHPSAR